MNRPGKQKTSNTDWTIEVASRSNGAALSGKNKNQRDALGISLTNIFFQSDTGEHAGQVVVSMRSNSVQMRSRRVFHVVGAYTDLSNAIFPGTDSKFDLLAEHRCRRFFPQIGRMRSGR